MLSDANRRTIRTVFQTAVSLAAALPLIVAASGVKETSASVVLMLAIAAGLTHVMALPVVENLLPKWLRKESTLRKDAPSDGGNVADE